MLVGWCRCTRLPWLTTLLTSPDSRHSVLTMHHRNSALRRTLSLQLSSLRSKWWVSLVFSFYNFVPDAATMDPMREERMNCARKTMQLTMAMSVPMPRTCTQHRYYYLVLSSLLAQSMESQTPQPPCFSEIIQCSLARSNHHIPHLILCPAFPDVDQQPPDLLEEPAVLTLYLEEWWR